MTKPYSEADLIAPTLEALEVASEVGLTTADLQTILRQELQPKGDDLLTLEGRSDDRFSQKVRNLKSHDTLETLGLAEFDDGRYRITAGGREFRKQMAGISSSLRKQGFVEGHRTEAVEKGWKGIFIEEGDATLLPTKVRKRSQLLRKAALKEFIDGDGLILCVGCGFEGTASYGEPGRGLIEIHHLEPISHTQGGIRTTLRNALEKVVPLCPNCHRMIHRVPGEMLTIKQLKAIVLTTGT